MSRIQSKVHNIGSYRINNISLSNIYLEMDIKGYHIFDFVKYR